MAYMADMADMVDTADKLVECTTELMQRLVGARDELAQIVDLESHEAKNLRAKIWWLEFKGAELLCLQCAHRDVYTNRYGGVWSPYRLLENQKSVAPLTERGMLLLRMNLGAPGWSIHVDAILEQRGGKLPPDWAEKNRQVLYEETVRLQEAIQLRNRAYSFARTLNK